MPLVSIVMGVFNSELSLGDTIESILDQTFKDFELIVVDDGSTDSSLEIIRSYEKKDNRIRCIKSSNNGLTKSLIKACAQSKGYYIARHDAGGDTSLPFRLERQIELFESKPELAIVSTPIIYVTEENEYLGGSGLTKEECKTGLLVDKLSDLRSPLHAASVFKRYDYSKVGGYREQFYYAQDIDLWLRLIELGGHEAVTQPSYRVVISPTGISNRARSSQLALAELAIRIRNSDKADVGDLLEKAAEIGPVRGKVTNEDLSKGYYYISQCFRGKDKKKSRKYLNKALQAWPFNVKALIRYLQQYVPFLQA